MQNPIREMVTKRQLGIHCGVPSFCCANKLVIEAVLEQAIVAQLSRQKSKIFIMN